MKLARDRSRLPIAAGLFALVLVVWPGRGGLVHAAEGDAIDLEIFNIEEIENAPDAKISAGCALSLWQHDKAPYEDKYYFVFYRDTGTEETADTGYIQIDGKFMPVKLFAAGGKDHGFWLNDRQVYRGDNGDLWAILDLQVGKQEGEAIPVTGGTMRVLQNGKNPFLVKVKGDAGC